MFWHFGILSTKVAGAGDVLADRQTATHTNGDAENARHEIAGHENAAPCCRGEKCET